VNVRPAFRDPAPTDKEIVTLYKWFGYYGWANRMLGGKLYVHTDNIISTGVETLKQGSQLFVFAAPPHRMGQTWIAVEAEIFCDDAAEVPNLETKDNENE
jgi:hypothetical protein